MRRVLAGIVTWSTDWPTGGEGTFPTQEMFARVIFCLGGSIAKTDSPMRQSILSGIDARKPKAQGGPITKGRMKVILITALLLGTGGMLLPCAHAQQGKADPTQLDRLRAEAESGDAQAQFDPGKCHFVGGGVKTTTALEPQ